MISYLFGISFQLLLFSSRDFCLECMHFHDSSSLSHEEICNAQNTTVIKMIRVQAFAFMVEIAVSKHQQIDCIHVATVTIAF
jgi:hypothetical protein